MPHLPLFPTPVSLYDLSGMEDLNREVTERLVAESFAAVAEAVTGVVLIVFPSIVFELLFGAEIAGAGVVVSRLAGISLRRLGKL